MKGVQKTAVKSIYSFEGMNSFSDPRVIKDGEFPRLVNVLFEGTKIKTRTPYKKVIANTVTGSFKPKGLYSFQSNAKKCLLYCLANGKLLYFEDGDTTPTELLLDGASPISPGADISVTQHFGDCFIADGHKLFKVDFDTNTVSDITSVLDDTGIDNPRFVISWNNSLWVFDTLGQYIASAPEVDIETDPNAFDASDLGLAFYNIAAKNDGMYISQVAISNSTLVINKFSPESKRGAIFTILGTSKSTYVQKEVSNNMGFIGKSAVSVGTKILGLTFAKFDFLSTIEKYGNSVEYNTPQSQSSFESGMLEDFIKDFIDDINYSNSSIVTASYHPQENAYYCSFCVGENSLTNNLIARIDLTNNMARISFWTNAFALGLAYFNGYMYFIDDRANVWRMEDKRQETKDSGYEEEEFQKYIETKAFTIADGIEFRVHDILLDLSLQNKTSKTLRVYYKTWTRDIATGCLFVQYSKPVLNLSSLDRNLKVYEDTRPSRLGSFTLDEDYFDKPIFQRLQPRIEIEKQAQFIQLIIADYSKDDTGNNGWTLNGLQLKGTVNKEI